MLSASQTVSTGPKPEAENLGIVLHYFRCEKAERAS